MVRFSHSCRFYYDITAFTIANGSLIGWLIYGCIIYYSDANDCDNYDSTAFFNSIMLIVIFFGYFMGFVLLMIVLSLPCLYFMENEEIVPNRNAAAGGAVRS